MRLSDIDSDREYKTGELRDLVIGEGMKAAGLIRKGKAEGTLPFRLGSGNGVGGGGKTHFIKGANVVSFLKGEWDKIQRQEDLLAVKYKDYSRQDLIAELVRRDGGKIKNEISHMGESNEQKLKLDIKIKTERINDLENRFLEYKKEIQGLKLDEYAKAEMIGDLCIKYIIGKQPLQHINLDIIGNCGVYLLFKKGKVVYVGQSVNVPSRVAEHHRMGKDFDEVRFFTCEPEERYAKEAFLIRLLQPELNKDKIKRSSDDSIYSIVTGFEQTQEWLNDLKSNSH